MYMYNKKSKSRSSRRSFLCLCEEKAVATRKTNNDQMNYMMNSMSNK